MMDATSLAELRDKLRHLNGCQARAWLYLQSLRQLHIQLGEEEPFADLICYGCIRIEMVDMWKNSSIQLTEDTEKKLIVFDEKCKFKVVCGMVRVVEKIREPLV